MTINWGFGWVLRVRWLRAHPKRKHIFRTTESREQLRERDTNAREFLERRRQAWLEGTNDLSDIEREIARLGYVFVDEPDVDDGRYSYWRKR